MNPKINTQRPYKPDTSTQGIPAEAVHALDQGLASLQYAQTVEDMFPGTDGNESGDRAPLKPVGNSPDSAGAHAPESEDGLLRPGYDRETGDLLEATAVATQVEVERVPVDA